MYLNKMRKRTFLDAYSGKGTEKNRLDGVVSSKEGVTTNMYFDIKAVFCSVI